MPIVHELPYNTYDTPGNIRQVKQGSTVTGTYTYGNSNWRDLLTAYNNQPIAYEGQTFNGSAVSGTPVSGNPISYFNGTRWEFDWSEGRQLVTATAAADGTVTVQVLDFAYDNAGTPYALTYTNGTTSTTYYYITNLQGDVMYLVEANGDTAAEYAYDAYGNITTATGSMAEINPLPYCGYGRLKTSFSWTSEMGASFFVSSRTKFLQKQHMGLWWIFAPCRAYPLLFLEGSERPWKNTSRK